HCVQDGAAAHRAAAAALVTRLACAKWRLRGEFSLALSWQRASLGAGAKGCAKPRGPTVQAISCGLLTCRPGTPLDDPVARITSSPYFLGLFKVTISYPRELFFCRGIRR